jgi:hypothetical protein
MGQAPSMTFFLYWWMAGVSGMLAMCYDTMVTDDSWVNDAYRSLYTNTPEYFWLFVFMMSILLGPLLWVYYFCMWIKKQILK